MYFYKTGGYQWKESLTTYNSFRDDVFKTSVVIEANRVWQTCSQLQYHGDLCLEYPYLEKIVVAGVGGGAVAEYSKALMLRECASL